MAESPSVHRIRSRCEAHGLAIESDQLTLLASYLGLLTKWNKTVNLTALPLSPPTDGGLDRLLIEPLLAARVVQSAVRELQTAGEVVQLLDVGSGGGSPAVPLAIALGPGIALRMVESKSRKAAFLREVMRQLPIHGADVVNARLDDLLGKPEFENTSDFASIRAVRADRDLWATLGHLMKPGGVVLWFRSESDAAGPDPVFFPQFLLEAVHQLIPAAGSEIAVLRKLTGTGNGYREQIPGANNV